MSKSQAALGIDVGGSSVKLGIVRPDGEVISRATIPNAENVSPRSFFEPVVKVARQLITESQAAGLLITSAGCGIPGTFEEGAEFTNLCNVPCLHGFPIRPYLEHELALPVAVDNDACLAALGEVYSLERLRRRVLFVTIGSGLGVVFVVENRVARISHGATGCAGHLIVNPTSEERCPLGCKGCLETVASARGILAAARTVARQFPSSPLGLLARSNEFEVKNISALATHGDVTCQELIVASGRWLGIGLASWTTVYGPDLVLLGGAVAQSGQDWLEAAISSMRSFGITKFTEHLDVERARLGNDAGVVGAALTSSRLLATATKRI